MKDIWRRIVEKVNHYLHRGEMSKESGIKSSENEDTSNPLSGDNPLSDPRNDLLESAPFSKLIARSISRMRPSEGIVMAVNGPWGSGKSTILNFVLYYLQHDFTDPNVVVIRFNPWWFPGREDLTRLLISLIRIRLGDKGHEDLKNKLADFSELVSKIPIIPGIEAGGFIAEKLSGCNEIN
jgi:predicted KAP-like P-loop ATPase